MDDSGIGRSRTISISNTRKITAKRKNRSEKGMRADDFGSKPHSNGVAFSRWRLLFIDVMERVSIMMRGNIIAKVIVTDEVSISLE